MDVRRQLISSGSPFEPRIGMSRAALEQAGASLADVVRTRTLLTRIEDWDVVTRVHGEIFGTIRPANTVMQVVRFVDPEWLVEFEADAIISGPGASGQ
jgi:enamine deaminase RidA (YjgF/YER057c/UK114 family)